MRLPRRTAVALAVLLGLLAVAVAYVFLSGQQEQVPEVPEMVELPVPIADIPARTDLRKDMFEQKSFATKDIPTDAVSTAESLHARLNLKELKQGEPIAAGLVTVRSTSLALAYGIPEHYRAMTVPVNDVSGVANFIKPGDHVDLLAIFTAATGDSVAKTVLQDIEVLAVNAVTTPPETNDDDDKADKPQSRRGTEERTITISVTPHDAQIVALSHHTGQIRMTLRRTGDTLSEPLERSKSWVLIGEFPAAKDSTPGGDRPPGADMETKQPPSWAEMWGSAEPARGVPAGPPEPAAKPKEPSVEVIRGLSREYVTPDE
jgi:pilus assembly protein CpaB